MGFNVLKVDGSKVPFDREKILQRLKKLMNGLDSNYLNCEEVTKKVSIGLQDGMSTKELDELLAETCAYMSQNHPDFSYLAARVAISRLHKTTSESFSETVEILANHKDLHGVLSPLVSDELRDVVRKHKDVIDEALDFKMDFNYDYFGFRTLERSYLQRVDGDIVERPQHMLMRVSLGIHGENIDAAMETYKLMSQGLFTHASPTLFNAGTRKPQMSSCFLLTMQSDSIEGIYETLRQTALISKSAGGIGIAASKIRAQGSYIRGTNGRSNGLVPMLRVYNNTARYVDQGGGKRKGSFAVYIEPWHADIFEVVELRKNHGKEEERARDLFYGLWIPDLFMKRVQENKDWTLFCPNEIIDKVTKKPLFELWGEEFERAYEQAEKDGLGRKTIKAQQLWFKILESQMETGTPYMLYKDACNRKSNQRNLGTIQCSNLCTEIVEYTSKDEVAVCNLASVALSKFVVEKDGKNVFDFDRLKEIVKVMTRNLNAVIDRNYYPIPEARNSNMRHRPIGLGVQGLADAFMKLRYPFESPEAKQLNSDIFECIYYAACDASIEIAEKLGPYETYEGSPASKGELQHDMWGWDDTQSKLNDWPKLKERLAKFGMRNSLLVAPMPTASTAQILGNNESFEPYTMNIYTRRVLSGEFVQVNRHLLRDLIAKDLWNDNLRKELIMNNGSVLQLHIPEDMKALYKTVWEIKQKTLVEMAADRGRFIDQSQSFNVHMIDANTTKLTSMHFCGWGLGLKTGMYYFRTKAARDAIKFTMDPLEMEKKLIEQAKKDEASVQNKFECHNCSA